MRQVFAVFAQKWTALIWMYRYFASNIKTKVYCGRTTRWMKVLQSINDTVPTFVSHSSSSFFTVQTISCCNIVEPKTFGDLVETAFDLLLLRALKMSKWNDLVCTNSSLNDSLEIPTPSPGKVVMTSFSQEIHKQFDEKGRTLVLHA